MKIWRPVSLIRKFEGGMPLLLPCCVRCLLGITTVVPTSGFGMVILLSVHDAC